LGVKTGAAVGTNAAVAAVGLKDEAEGLNEADPA
jgi:hypothetical protein